MSSTQGKLNQLLSQPEPLGKRLSNIGAAEGAAGFFRSVSANVEQKNQLRVADISTGLEGVKNTKLAICLSGNGNESILCALSTTECRTHIHA